MASPVGVYIHVPFCLAKCAYCDFPSMPKAGCEADVEAYFRALIKEIRGSEELRLRGIGTVFIGGGTPTAAPPFWLARTLEELWAAAPKADFAGVRNSLPARVGNPGAEISPHMLTGNQGVLQVAPTENQGVAPTAPIIARTGPGAEVTVEANPGTLSGKILRTLKNSGANRLSIGLQAWQNRLLKTLGRAHTKDVFLRQYAAAAEAGFENINVDLMFGLPGQTLGDWAETLARVVSLEPRPAHISAYSLIPEPGTPFREAVEKGLLVLPDEETDRGMYEDCVAFLAENGYRRYEISNFALENAECGHNLKYWRREETLGFGLGAHSFFGGARWNNPYDLSEYIARAEAGRLPECRPVPVSEAMEEAVFLGLRMAEGICLDRFEREFGVSFRDKFGGRAEEMAALGLLRLENGKAALTDRGFSLSEKVIEKLLVG